MMMMMMKMLLLLMMMFFKACDVVGQSLWRVQRCTRREREALTCSVLGPAPRVSAQFTPDWLLALRRNACSVLGSAPRVSTQFTPNRLDPAFKHASCTFTSNHACPPMSGQALISGTYTSSPL